MTTPLLIDDLTRHPDLAVLERGVLQEIAATAQRMSVAPYNALLREGEAATSLFLLVEGVVRAGRTRPDGSQAYFAEAGPGTLLAVVEAADGGAATATFTALGPCTVLAIPLHVLKSRSAMAFALKEVLALDLARRLRAANGRAPGVADAS